jgi:hypothetical protein
MQTFFKAMKSFWQVGVPVWVILFVLEFIKPGFVLSGLNMNVLSVTMLAAFITDTLWGENI